MLCARARCRRLRRRQTHIHDELGVGEKINERVPDLSGEWRERCGSSRWPGGLRECVVGVAAERRVATQVVRKFA